MITHRTKGSTLMEVVIAAAILAAVATAFLATIATISKFHQKNMLVIKGELLAEEGLEVLRFLKEDGYAGLAALAVGQAYYFALNGSTWSYGVTPELVDGVFTRSFRVYDVMRDASGAIVSAGGTVDPDTKRFVVTVEWVWRQNLVVSEYSAYMMDL